MKNQISFYSNAFDSSSTVTFDIINLPELISKSHADIIKKIRQIRSTTDKEERNKVKLTLPMFTAAGVFSHRHNDTLKEYSNFICLDFDGIVDTSRYIELMESFITLPSVYMAFMSPSGGIKVIVCHNNDNPQYHQNMFYQLKALPQFNVPEFDDSSKNLCRSTFVSWDPYLYVNHNVIPYNYHYDPAYDFVLPVRQKYLNGSNGHRNSDLSTLVNNFPDGIQDQTIIGWMDKHEWRQNPHDYQEGNRHNSLMKKAGRMASWGVSYKAALDILLYKYKYYGLPENDIVKAVDYCYEHNDFGGKRQEFLTLKGQYEEEHFYNIFSNILKKK